MRLRVTIGLVAAALLVAACGGQPADSGSTGTSAAQAGAEKLLEEYQAVPGCGCTGAVRAKERAATLFTYAGTGLAAQTK